MCLRRLVLKHLINIVSIIVIMIVLYLGVMYCGFTLNVCHTGKAEKYARPR